MTKKKIGRTSKFTPETRKKLIDHISIGVTDKDACGVAGITTTAFYEWLEIGRAHIEERDHERMPKTVEDRQRFADFVEDISRARAAANNAALVAFKTGLRDTQIVEETTETFSETRLDANNVPFTYTRSTNRTTVRKQPADWRAGEAWLRRRDPDNWSDKIDTRAHEGGTSWDEIMRAAADETEDSSSEGDTFA